MNNYYDEIVFEYRCVSFSMMSIMVVVMVVVFSVMSTRSVEDFDTVADTPNPTNDEWRCNELEQAPHDSAAARHSTASIDHGADPRKDAV